MSDNGIPDFDSLVLGHIKLEKAVNDRKKIAQQMRDYFYTTYVKPYDDEIKALDDRLSQSDATLRATALEHASSTGELKPHPRITLVRGTKLVYDREAAEKQLIADGQYDYFRMALKVREFERDAEPKTDKHGKVTKPGKFSWFNGERTPAPHVQMLKWGAESMILDDPDGETKVLAYWQAERDAEVAALSEKLEKAIADGDQS